MVGNSESNSAASASAPAIDRLPCRGCMPDCSNYASCEGRPWRLNLAGATVQMTDDRNIPAILD